MLLFPVSSLPVRVLAKVGEAAVTVAVAADMTARILARIAGNELATTINGVSQTRDKITLMSTNQIISELNKKAE